MPIYRYFALDKTNRIYGAEVLNAADDETAVSIGERLRARMDAPGFEVWERTRPVLQCPAEPKAS